MKLPLQASGLVLLLLILSNTSSHAQVRSQLWQNTSIEKSLGPNYSANLNLGIRLTPDGFDLAQWLVNPSVAIRVHPHLTIGPGYLYQISYPAHNGRHTREHRLNLDFTPNGEWGNLRLADRNRVERRNVNGQISYRYRNQIRVEYRVARAALLDRVFTFNEVFYDSRSRSFSQYRLGGGVGKSFTDRVTLEFFYQRQIPLAPIGTKLNIIGSGLRVRL